MYDDFSALFTSITAQDDEIRGETAQEKAERLKDEADEEKRLKKWKWMGLVYAMSRGDIAKRDQILNMNFISVLNWMAYEKEHPDVFKFYNARN